MMQWLKDILQPAAVARAPARAAGAPQAMPPTTVRAVPGETLAKQLALVIDLNVCVGCHACVTSCKQWNTSGSAGPLADENAYGANPTGTFFNRVQTYEAGSFPSTETVHSPRVACIAKTRPACRCAQPAPATNARKTVLCWLITTNASAANTARGPALTEHGSWMKNAR